MKSPAIFLPMLLSVLTAAANHSVRAADIANPRGPSAPGESCASAILIGALPFAQTFNNDLNTASAPRGSCNSVTTSQMQNAQWYRWTPATAATARLFVAAQGGGYDVIAAVHRGSCDTLVEVACADEPEPLELFFCAVAGETYFIQIGDFGAIEGGGPTDILLSTTPATGACCLNTGECLQLTVGGCAAVGGSFAGNCVTCAAAGCPPGGACCLSGGQCAPRTVAACAAAGGQHLGIGAGCFEPSGEPPVQFVVEVNEMIPDGDELGIPSALTITQPIVATDLNVFVRVPDHSFISDMRITLEFGGVTRVLWDRACADEDGLMVTFDDEGTDNECEEPMSGFIKPSIFGDGTLEVFEQRPMQGTWTLTIVDEALPDTGLFASWGLVVTPGQPRCAGSCIRGDTNCDGAVNNFDIDPFVQAIINNSSPTAPAEYLAGGGTQQCWEQRGCWGDINQDGGLTNFDIDPFVECLIVLPPPGQSCP